jgi:hypothetical protein
MPVTIAALRVLPPISATSVTPPAVADSVEVQAPIRTNDRSNACVFERCTSLDLG